MRGLGKLWNGNGPGFAGAVAGKRAGDGDGPGKATAAAGLPADVVSVFPRGMDGDRHKPVATARWVSSAELFEMLGAWKPGRFLIGRDSAGRYVGHDDDRHILTVAGSRAGKGVSLIVPALLQWPHSCIAIDPKGELATITAARRSSVDSQWAMAMGGDVYVLDPFHRVTGPAEAYRAAFNPLAGLNPDTDDGLDLAGQIADALVVQQKGPGSHWTLSARAFLRGLVLYIAKTEPETGNLLRVRELHRAKRRRFREPCWMPWWRSAASSDAPRIP